MVHCGTLLHNPDGKRAENVSEALLVTFSRVDQMV
jgi:hypothetical protein